LNLHIYINVSFHINYIIHLSRVCIDELEDFLYICFACGSCASTVGPYSKARSIQKQPEDSSNEYGDVFNGMNIECARPFALLFVIFI
jgi:hypothetical protein